MDGPLSEVDQIFSGFAKQFNDPGLTLSPPERAEKLESHHLLSPNDQARIAITRDYIWLRNLYFDTLKQHNAALKKWTKGTGGGPGYPENFSDWGERNGEYFSNYASAGKGDYLAWIYMLDKQIDYGFNTINDPAPADTTMEDGANRLGEKRGRKDKKGKHSSEQEFGKIMSDSMDKFGQIIAMSLGSTSDETEGNTGPVQQETYQNPNEDDEKDVFVASIDSTMNLITKLEAQHKAMCAVRDNNRDFQGRMPKRIKYVEKAIERSYSRLNKIVDGDVDVDDDDDYDDYDDDDDDDDDDDKADFKAG